MKQGKVWLVGAGPSDAGLITVKGMRVLQEADVVVYDRLVGAGILNRIPQTARRIDVGKQAGRHPVSQEEINRILLNEALSGNRVVRLKGGDPFVFGRGGEELALLCEHGIAFEVVPGVTSAVAVPAYAGIPVTHRDFCSSLHIITGHRKGEGEALDYKTLARLDGMLVFLMGAAALEEICSGLCDGGMPASTPAAILEKGTTCEQRRVVSTLAELANEAKEKQIATPAIIVVGGVCALSAQFAWAEKRALGGVRVIVTRPQKLCSALTEQLEAQGAEVIELPCIKTKELSDQTRLKKALEERRQYTWAAFTSAMGVEVFFCTLRSMGLDARALAGMQFAAIGRGTAQALEQNGIAADYMPEQYHALALGEGLARAAKGERVLIPRAAEGSIELTQALENAGVAYEDIPVYETVYEKEDVKNILPLLPRRNTFVSFTSASTVRGFAGAVGEYDYSTVQALCIGEQTAAEARARGMQVWVAREASLSSMTERLIEIKEERKNG